MSRRTGLVWHELYMWHNTGKYAGVMPPGLQVQPYEHSEHPETKRRFKNLLDVAGLTEQLVAISPRPATEAEILMLHEPDHLDRMKVLNETGGEAGIGTPMGVGSYDIALLAAGGVIELVDALLDQRVDNGYALVRPPGHHAKADMGMGFCIFCNGAIAGLHAMNHRGLERIAYVDWDVHHGNGTEAAFWEDPRALTISIHQQNLFPLHSGGMDQRGAGAGEGFNLNIPLPPGSGYGAYEAVFDRVVIPALKAFSPELIIVPSGFDAGIHDSLGRQLMHSRGYRELTAKLMRTADQVCGGRLMMCHEGGYDASTVPYMGLAVLEELSGIKTDIDDPLLEVFEQIGGQDLQPHQDAVILQAEPLLDTLRT